MPDVAVVQPGLGYAVDAAYVVVLSSYQARPPLRSMICRLGQPREASSFVWGSRTAIMHKDRLVSLQPLARLHALSCFLARTTA